MKFQTAFCRAADVWCNNGVVKAHGVDGDIQRGLTDVSANLDAAVSTMDVSEANGFELLERPGWSINKRWEWCQLALTGRLKEFDPEN